MPERLPEGVDPQLWHDVAQARREFFEQQFGPLLEQIQKLVNLSEIWPGGGLYQMEAPRLKGLGVCVTYGLTNSDMPASLRPAKADHDNGPVSSGVEPREPRAVPPGLAGYGYELLILTPTPDPWPLLSLSWFVQMELVNDLDLLGRMAVGNGVVVENVKFGDGSRTAHYLVQLACAPIAGRVKLPNGLMHVLIATRITDDELEFAKGNEDGRWELWTKLLDGGVGPVSRLDRSSVLTR